MMGPRKQPRRPISPLLTLPMAREQSAAGSGSVHFRDWSSLMEPLLLDILRRLDTLHDFFAFRGVCRSWRVLAVPTRETLASQHPLLLVHFPGLEKQAYYDVVLRRVYSNRLFEPLFPLFYVSYSYSYQVTFLYDGELVLRNIFTDAVIRLPRVPPSLTSPSDYCVLFSSNPASPDCLILLFEAEKEHVCCLCIGDRNPCWTVVHCLKGVNVADMIYFKNKLYALTWEMGLLTVDLATEPHIEVLGDGKESRSIVERDNTRISLAVSGDELLVACYNIESGIDLFRWDFISNGWEVRQTLDGRVLFMGRSSFAGSMDATATGLRGDCIHSLIYRTGERTEFSLKDQSLVGACPLVPGEGKGLVWVFPSNC